MKQKKIDVNITLACSCTTLSCCLQSYSHLHSSNNKRCELATGIKKERVQSSLSLESSSSSTTIKCLYSGYYIQKQIEKRESLTFYYEFIEVKNRDTIFQVLFFASILFYNNASNHLLLLFRIHFYSAERKKLRHVKIKYEIKNYKFKLKRNVNFSNHMTKKLS
jgi:hypothetical protein